MNELLKDFTFVVDLNIEWGDMDALQHVNNIEYFKYFQVARIAYFEKINSDSVFGENTSSIDTSINPMQVHLPTYLPG